MDEFLVGLQARVKDSSFICPNGVKGSMVTIKTLDIPVGSHPDPAILKDPGNYIWFKHPSLSGPWPGGLWCAERNDLELIPITNNQATKLYLKR